MVARSREGPERVVKIGRRGWRDSGNPLVDRQKKDRSDEDDGGEESEGGGPLHKRRILWDPRS